MINKEETMRSPLTELLQGSWVSPDTGASVQLPPLVVRIDAGVAKEAVACIEALKCKGVLLLVSDKNTQEALGKALEKQLSSAFKVKSLVLEAGVAAEDTVAARIQAAAAEAEAEALIAVGSGTINDLVKYASAKLKRPYAVFGTAPSMNGYASANASITVGGHKKTLPAQMPRGIFLDTGVLAKAPIRLIRSGVGDSLCRSTAQVDWCFSHLILGTSYKKAPFALLEPLEEAFYGQVEGLVKGDAGAMEVLAHTLVLSGLGMYLAGGSYPASQGEHMIAHTMEMAYGQALPSTYHGEQIAVTTLTMARRQRDILERGGQLASRQVPDSLGELLGRQLAEACKKEYEQKFSAPGLYETAQALVRKRLDGFAQVLKPLMVNPERLEKILSAVGAPVTPLGLQWKENQYDSAVAHARFTRNRFTFLDLETVS